MLEDDLAMTSMARLWEVGKSEPIKVQNTTDNNINKVGKASPSEGTMPSSMMMLRLYGHDPITCMKRNALVGGDNASRAVAIGAVLGAKYGYKYFSEIEGGKWVEG